MTSSPWHLAKAIIGLYAAFIMGLVTAIIRGRPCLFSGGAGAIAVVLIALMQAHGIGYVFAAVAFSGVVQILMGVLKLGKFGPLVNVINRSFRITIP